MFVVVPSAFNAGMATQEQEDIAAAQAILNAGITQTSMDGQTTTFAHDTLERRLRELKSQNLTSLANNQVRPVMQRMTFSRFGG